MVYRFANPYTVTYLLVVALACGLAAVSYRYRSKRAATPLVGFLLSVATWSFGDAMRIAARSEAAVLFWNKVSYVGIAFVLPSFVLFVVAFTNRERWLQRRYVLSLLAVSTVALTVVLTNPLHSLWRAGETFSFSGGPPVLVEHRGILWYPWAIYSYVLTLGALAVLGQEFLNEYRSRAYRSQAGVILGGSLVSVTATAAFLLGLVPFDPTPLGFGVVGLAFSTVIFRYELLDITPIARDVIVDNVNSGVLVLDVDDTVVDANPIAKRVLYLDESDVPGVSLSTLLAERPDLQERFEEVRETSETITVEDDDEVRHYNVEVTPITDPLDAYLGRTVVFSDVTDEVRREARLREQTERLREQNERLDEFASVVSHDLRNPLEIAQGYLKPARETGDEEFFDEMERGLDRMDRLIDDVLLFARQGTTVEEVDEVDLESLAREAWFHLATPESDLHLGGIDGERLLADRDRLLRAFENLYRNAIDHNGERVTVTVGTLDDRDGFYVEDDGTGIPPDEREKVFERGYTTDEDGTGFGLAIVEKVVQAHGWNLEVATGTTGGARFEVETDVAETVNDGDAIRRVT